MSAARERQLEAEITFLEAEVTALRAALIDVTENGSRNFRHYRRWALAGYVVLVVGVMAAIAVAVTQGATARDRLAVANQKVTLESCRSGNDLRNTIVVYISSLPRSTPAFAARAAASFRPIDCQARIAPLEQAK